MIRGPKLGERGAMDPRIHGGPYPLQSTCPFRTPNPLTRPLLRALVKLCLLVVPGRLQRWLAVISERRAPVLQSL